MIGRSLALSAFLTASALAACASAPASSAPPASASRARPPACTEPAPSYEADVRPILERRCYKCHAEDGVAADEHDFSRIATLRAQSDALAREITASAMPPSSEPPLPREEANVLLRWAACASSHPGDAIPERGP